MRSENWLLLVVACTVASTERDDPEAFDRVSEPDPISEYSSIPNFFSADGVMAQRHAASIKECAYACNAEQICRAFQFGQTMCVLFDRRASTEGFDPTYNYYERRLPVQPDVRSYLDALQSRRPEPELYDLELSDDPMSGSGAGGRDSAVLRKARAEARAIMARANETLAAAKKESEANKRIVQTWMIEDKQLSLAPVSDVWRIQDQTTNAMADWKERVSSHDLDAASKQMQRLTKLLAGAMDRPTQKTSTAVKQLNEDRAKARLLNKKSEKLERETSRLTQELNRGMQAINAKIAQSKGATAKQANKMTTGFNALNKKLSQYLEDAIGEAGNFEKRTHKMHLMICKAVTKIEHGYAEEVAQINSDIEADHLHATKLERDALKRKERALRRIKLNQLAAEQRTLLIAEKRQARNTIKRAKSKARHLKYEIVERAEEQVVQTKYRAKVRMQQAGRESFVKVHQAAIEREHAIGTKDWQLGQGIAKEQVEAAGKLAQLQQSEKRDSENTARSAAGFETEQAELLRAGEHEAQQLQSAVLNATNKDSNLQLSSTAKRQQVEQEAIQVSANPANASAAQMRQIQRKDSQLSRKMLKERKAKRELGDAKQAVKSQSTAMLRQEVNLVKNAAVSTVAALGEIKKELHHAQDKLEESKEVSIDAQDSAAEQQELMKQQVQAAENATLFKLQQLPEFVTELQRAHPIWGAKHAAHFGQAEVVTPHSIVLLCGRAYVTDHANNAVFRLATSDGSFVRLAGGRRGRQDGTGQQARFSEPASVAALGRGKGAGDVIYVVDSGSSTVRRLVTKEISDPVQVSSITDPTKLESPAGVALLQADKSGEVALVSSHTALWLVIASSKGPKVSYKMLLEDVQWYLGQLEVASVKKSHALVLATDSKCRCIRQFKVQLNVSFKSALSVEFRATIQHSTMQLPLALPRYNHFELRTVRVGRGGLLVVLGQDSGASITHLLQQADGNQLKLQGQIMHSNSIIGLGSHGIANARSFPTITADHQIGAVQLSLQLQCAPWMTTTLAAGWRHNSTTEDPDETGQLLQSAQMRLQLRGSENEWQFWAVRRLQSITLHVNAQDKLPAKITKHMLCFHAIGQGERGCCSSNNLTWDLSNNMLQPDDADMNALIQGF